MAAVLPFLEQRPPERGHQSVLDGIAAGVAELTLAPDDLRGLGVVQKVKLDADGEPIDPLAKSHTELSRLLWARTLVAKALVGAKFRVDTKGADIAVIVEVASAQERDEKTGGLRRDAIPWHFNSKSLPSFKLFSENSKMRCPTFDLPAGMSALGGSCPGATYAQSTVPTKLLQSDTSRDSATYGTITNAPEYLLDEVEKDWRVLAAMPQRQPGDDAPRLKALNLKSVVCQHCYATGGKYGEVGVQFAEVAKYAFVQALVKRDPELLVQLLYRTIKDTLKWDEETTKRHGVRPIRVHSSGDFYSKDYARVWLKVAQLLWADPDTQDIRLWAPTRTHVVKGMNEFWRAERDAGHIPPNFVIRPSAYSVGDPAPYIGRESPTGCKGTAVLFPDDAAPRMRRKGKAEFGDGTKFDFQCGVYALEKGNKTCLSSIAPDGKVGCRACWTQPHLAVSYVLH